MSNGFTYSMPASLKPSLSSQRLEGFTENQYACFKAFFAIHVREGNTASEMFSYPFALSTITQRYPGIEKFSFPFVHNTSQQRVIGGGNCTFVFILTDDSGNRLYGHCANTVNREAFVFLSNKPWVTFFRQILYTFRVNGPESGMAMVAHLYTACIPPPGGMFDIRPGGLVLCRPRDYPHCTFADTNPSLLLDIFTDQEICQIVSCLLLEQNVIICGPDFSITSRVILALLGILSPLEWHHILISVVTSNLIDMLAAPTPFLVGIVHAQKEHINKVSIESAVYVEIMDDEFVYSGISMMCMEPLQRHGRRKVFLGMEDERPCKCTAIRYIGEDEVPLPRTNNILSSTIRKSLKVLRVTQTDEERTSDNMCVIFMQFYAKNLGMFGAPDFNFFEFIAKLTNDPGRASSEVEFYKKFKESQCCEVLRLFISEKVFYGSWMDDEFCKMAVEFNKEYYRSVLEGFESVLRGTNKAIRTPASLLFSSLKTFLRE
eukprot:Tbor_TRINITY_DN2591_c0_g1::TRINITY_DN2591_c0_g1_i1::g.567::m.567/K20161/DENND2; DENN domain-containing protein 2